MNNRFQRAKLTDLWCIAHGSRERQWSSEQAVSVQCLQRVELADPLGELVQTPDSSERPIKSSVRRGVTD